MIPIKLTLTGFLSYRDTTELDFTSFDLACISGQNGAGKSSLLDAITWALFGQARKRDESIVNLQSGAAEVALVFEYESNTYRIQRTLPKGKTTRLEFQILQPADGKWKALTGETLRNTQEVIEHTLRLDYDTFVNASFFLQGKADQFTQQKASDRKRILGNILGLEVWDVYRERGSRRRRAAEAEIQNLEGRMQEINAELSEETSRTDRLQSLQTELKQLEKARRAQEKLLEQARKVEASLNEQRKLVDVLKRQLQAAEQRYAEMESRLESRVTEQKAYAEKLARASEIEAAYAGWQAIRAELERWDEVARRFREHDARRQAPLLEIEAEKARLSTEMQQLTSTSKTVQEQASAHLEAEAQLEAARHNLAQAEETLDQRSGLEVELQFARQRQAEARAENPRLRQEMIELKARVDKLTETEEPACPLCGRPMDTYERNQLIDSITAEGTELGDRYRANQAYLSEADQVVSEIEAHIASLAAVENERLGHLQNITRLQGQLEFIEKNRADWEERGAPRLAEVNALLQGGNYASEARKALAGIDKELKAIGYDAAAHDTCRQQEGQLRSAEAEFRSLETARAALQPLEREIEDNQTQLTKLHADISNQQGDHDEAVARLAAAEAAAPDLEETERLLHELLEQENTRRMEVGAAQQKVAVLKDLKVRLKEINVQREEQAKLVSQYKQLDRAFGKDGVPALLIEQALPEIETRANELLERLSEGNMSVRFVTQAAFKDKKRDDLKETLDIAISDGSGTRDYELYSGGEAFRVNFAIRLALSELLAQRAGARLQTLVIDEGFGSQDALGRQHLIEAINMVRQDFAKVLVISHLDELKEAFPNRIEVEKTERGSTLRVV
ncbi:MAG: SMC family ATPase [Anaerolineae bacterium]|nr:SMC family ATPase [Anaerolineae bacterium]